MQPEYTPEECLKRARKCEVLARDTQHRESRTLFAELAAKWRALAAEQDTETPPKP